MSMSDRTGMPPLDDAHVAIFRERERLDAHRDPDDSIEYRWIERDPAGRIAAVLRGPSAGAERIAWSAELQAAADADFAAIRTEKLAGKPRAERVRAAIAEDPSLLEALFDTAARADPSNPKLAAAKARIDPTSNAKE